jgi:hypothetical protein
MAAYLAKEAVHAKDRAKRNRAIVKELNAGTATAAELAQRYGIDKGTVRTLYAAATGHPAPYVIRTGKYAHANRRPSVAYRVKRALAIVEGRRLGMTLQALADQFDIGCERVRQLHHLATRRDYVANLTRKTKAGKRRG